MEINKNIVDRKNSKKYKNLLKPFSFLKTYFWPSLTFTNVMTICLGKSEIEKYF